MGLFRWENASQWLPTAIRVLIYSESERCSMPRDDLCPSSGWQSRVTRRQYCSGPGGREQQRVKLVGCFGSLTLLDTSRQLPTDVMAGTCFHMHGESFFSVTYWFLSESLEFSFGRDFLFFFSFKFGKGVCCRWRWCMGSVFVACKKKKIKSMSNGIRIVLHFFFNLCLCLRLSSSAGYEWSETSQIISEDYFLTKVNENCKHDDWSEYTSNFYFPFFHQYNVSRDAVDGTSHVPLFRPLCVKIG